MKFKPGDRVSLENGVSTYVIMHVVAIKSPGGAWHKGYVYREEGEDQPVIGHYAREQENMEGRFKLVETAP